MKVKISPQIIVSISSLYDDINRIFLEYIDNSLDSAEDYYEKATNSYLKPIIIQLKISGNNSNNGSVIIEDNCTGIDSLERVCGSIGDSNKRTQPWTNGQFGYGIFSFMAVCENLKITSKEKDDNAYSMVIPKKIFEESNSIDSIQIDDKKIDKFNFESGTRVELNNFKKDEWKEIDPKVIKSEIESHFEQLLKRENLEVKIQVNDLTEICSTFDYNSINGPEWPKNISRIKIKRAGQFAEELLSPPIKIYLKLAENIKLDRPPIFVKNGRRIDEVKNIKAFKSKHKSDLWGHPKLTGYVDVGNHLDPNIARQGFRNTKNSKAVFEELIKLEEEIYEFLDLVNQNESDKHYSALEDYLNKALSGLAKIDNMNFRKEMQRGNEVPLSGMGSGSSMEIIEGGSKDFGEENNNSGGGINFGENEGDGFKFGDEKEDSNQPGDGSGEIGSRDDGFIDEEKTGKEKRKSGFNIKLVQREPDLNSKNELVRSQIIGGDIQIFIKHPDFKERVQKKRTGEEKITQRLITYLAGEITVHYKDAFYEKTKINNDYGKHLLEELVVFIYEFEKILKDLNNKNLSDLIS